MPFAANEKLELGPMKNRLIGAAILLVVAGNSRPTHPRTACMALGPRLAGMGLPPARPFGSYPGAGGIEMANTTTATVCSRAGQVEVANRGCGHKLTAREEQV